MGVQQRLCSRLSFYNWEYSTTYAAKRVSNAFTSFSSFLTRASPWRCSCYSFVSSFSLLLSLEELKLKLCSALWRIAFAPARKPDQIELFFCSHIKMVVLTRFLAVTEQSCASPIFSKVEKHISDRCSYYTGYIFISAQKAIWHDVNKAGNFTFFRGSIRVSHLSLFKARAHITTIIYLRHSLTLQLRVSSPGPWQSLPWGSGGGFVHVRSLTCFPVPHVLSHLVQSLHSLHCPSFGDFSSRKVPKNDFEESSDEKASSDRLNVVMQLNIEGNLQLVHPSETWLISFLGKHGHSTSGTWSKNCLNWYILKMKRVWWILSLCYLLPNFFIN